MTITELHPELITTESLSGQQIDRYYFNVGESEYVAVIAGPKDHRVESAIALEKETFESHGDDPEEISEEFGDYQNNSLFLFIHKAGGGAANEDRSRLLGMGRFIPYDATVGLKTFNDISEIASKSSIADTRNKILGALSIDEDVLTTVNGEEVFSLLQKRTEDLFCKYHECADLNKVIDIATLAPDMSMTGKEKFAVIEALLKAMAIYTTKLYTSGNLTHLVQFSASKFHELLRDFGYPVENLLGLEDLSYDSFGNGDTSMNMVATPSVLNAKKLDDTYLRIPPVTRHIARVVASLHQVLDY